MLKKSVGWIGGFVAIFVLLFAGWKVANPKAISLVPLFFYDLSTPCLIARIQGEPYHLEMHLDTKIPLALKPEILKKLKKKRHGILEWRDETGKEYKEKAYLIPSLTIGETVLKDVVACAMWKETTGDVVGKIGRPLLIRQALFIDLPHRIAVFGESISTIRKAGLGMEKTVSMPFQINRGGVVVDAKIDDKPLRLSLSPGANYIVLWVDKEGPSTSRLALGGRDFGARKVYSLDYPHLLHEIDGCLGMDFLKDFALYLDFKQCVAQLDTI